VWMSYWYLALVKAFKVVTCREGRAQIFLLPASSPPHFGPIPEKSGAPELRIFPIPLPPVPTLTRPSQRNLIWHRRPPACFRSRPLAPFLFPSFFFRILLIRRQVSVNLRDRFVRSPRLPFLPFSFPIVARRHAALVLLVSCLTSPSHPQGKLFFPESRKRAPLWVFRI